MNLLQNMVIPDISTKPDFYAKLDIDPFFAVKTLKCDEFAPKHGYF